VCCLSRLLELATSLRQRLDNAAAAQQNLDEALRVVEEVSGSPTPAAAASSRQSEGGLEATLSRPNVAAAAAAILRSAHTGGSAGSGSLQRPSSGMREAGSPARPAGSGDTGSGPSGGSSTRSAMSAALAAGAAAEGLAAARPSTDMLAGELSVMQQQLGMLTKQLALLAVAQTSQPRGRSLQPSNEGGVAAGVGGPEGPTGNQVSHGRRVSTDFSFPLAPLDIPAGDPGSHPNSGRGGPGSSHPQPSSGGRPPASGSSLAHQLPHSRLSRQHSSGPAADSHGGGYQPIMSGAASPREQAWSGGGAAGAGGGPPQPAEGWEPLSRTSSTRAMSRLGSGRSAAASPRSLSATDAGDLWLRQQHQPEHHTQQLQQQQQQQQAGVSSPRTAAASPRRQYSMDSAPGLPPSGSPAGVHLEPGSRDAAGSAPHSPGAGRAPPPARSAATSPRVPWPAEAPAAAPWQQQEHAHSQVGSQQQHAQWHWQQEQAAVQQQQQQQQWDAQEMQQGASSSHPAAAAQEEAQYQQVVLLQQQLARAVARGTKWKARARQLAQQLTALEAALRQSAVAQQQAAAAGAAAAGTHRESQESRQSSSEQRRSSGDTADTEAGPAPPQQQQHEGQAERRQWGVGPTPMQQLIAELNRPGQVGCGYRSQLQLPPCSQHHPVTPLCSTRSQHTACCT
jgi:hypothetical protein